MYKNITDDFIVTTISDFTEEMVLIEQKLEILSETAEDDAEKIEAASLPGRSDEVKVQINGKKTDLLDVYAKYQYLIRSQSKDCALYAKELLEKKDSMERVKAAYECLPKREYEVLGAIYKDGVPQLIKEGIQQAAKSLYISERQIRRIRTRAINSIRTIYEGDRTLLDLRLSAVEAASRRKRVDVTA